MSITNGIHHLGLSVSNLQGAVEFFTDALGFTLTGRNDDYPAAFVKDQQLLLTLWATDADPRQFDRKNNEGLHHFALNISNHQALEFLYARLINWPDARVEKEISAMSPNSNTRHFFVRIPGGPRVEFISLKGEKE